MRGIEAYGYHGVLPEERAEGQPFVVDLEVRTDVSEAAATDDLDEDHRLRGAGRGSGAHR